MLSSMYYDVPVPFSHPYQHYRVVLLAFVYLCACKFLPIRLAAGMQNPKVMAAFQELMSSPGGAMGLMSDPSKLQKLMADPE